MRLLFAFVLMTAVAEAQYPAYFFEHRGHYTGSDSMHYPRHGSMLINPRNGVVQQDVGGGMWMDVQTGRVTQSHRLPDRSRYDSQYDPHDPVRFDEYGRRIRRR